MKQGLLAIKLITLKCNKNEISLGTDGSGQIQTNTKKQKPVTSAIPQHKYYSSRYLNKNVSTTTLSNAMF